MMIKNITWCGLGILIVAATLLYTRRVTEHSTDSRESVTIERRTLEAWTQYEGLIESESTQVIMSQFKGKTAIIYLAPEGSVVTQGSLLVEFDNSDLLHSITKLEYECSSAQAAHKSLVNAELPMEVAAIENELIESEFNYKAEKDFLEDSRELLADSLISTQEVFQQEHKVNMLETTLQQLKSKANLTKSYLHPTRLQRSENELQTLEDQLNEARRQLRESRIVSPASGMVSYTPLHISGEYRTVRIGDSVNQNQPFMNIPDMARLAVTCYVPEADLSRVQPGNPAEITPVAFPGLRLSGSVNMVGAMAQRQPGKPRWQKYFYVKVKPSQGDERLRTGMSAKVSIRSCRIEQALVIPRTAVEWNNGKPFCRMAQHPEKWHPLTLGKSSEDGFEVTDGLQEGDRILLP